MPKRTTKPTTFAGMTLVLLENRFPWLGDENEEVSGADTVEGLVRLHEDLVERCNRSENSDLSD